MIDFTQHKEHLSWQATNDNVMGGVSQGDLVFDGESSRFQGELSLANNGGFSSINRSIESVPFNTDQVELVFLGDGRTYQLRLATWKHGTRITYRHEFTTIKGKQQTKTFRLSDFQAVFRGRLINDAPLLQAKDIQQVGVLIADKLAGDFALNLIRIEFSRSKQTDE